MEVSRDDLVYIVLLLLGVGFGHFYRKIRDVDTKQATGTLFGIAMILFTSGFHSLHIFLTFTFCFIVIKFYQS